MARVEWTGGGHLPPITHNDGSTFSNIASRCVNCLIQQNISRERFKIQPAILIVLIILFVETVLQVLAARVRWRRLDNASNLPEPPHVPRSRTRTVPRNGQRVSPYIGAYAGPRFGPRVGQRLGPRLGPRVGLPAFNGTLADYIQEIQNSYGRARAPSS